jgi:uncharacterized membrane protein YphA (DoxX/SURF4 family)
MKNTINEAMKQDFASHEVLGRVLFGVAFLVLGLYSILNAKMFASNAPSFVPEVLAPLLTIAVGAVFAGGGFAIATGKAVARGAIAIAIVWALMAIFANLFSAYFDVREFFFAVAFIGAALTLKAQAEKRGMVEHAALLDSHKSTHTQDSHNRHH